MNESLAEQIPRLVFGHIVEALRVRDERLNAKTIQLCEALGPAIQCTLIGALAVGKCQPNHRVRLLQAIARTGPIIDANNWFDVLFVLSRDKHPQVRAEAKRFMEGMPERQSQRHQTMASPAPAP